MGDATIPDVEREGDESAVPGPGRVWRTGRGQDRLRGLRHRRVLGEVQPPLLAPRLPRVRGVLHVADVYGAALNQAVRGRRRLGVGDNTRDAHPDAGSTLLGGRGRGDASGGDGPVPL